MSEYERCLSSYQERRRRQRQQQREEANVAARRQDPAADKALTRLVDRIIQRVYKRVRDACDRGYPSAIVKVQDLCYPEAEPVPVTGDSIGDQILRLSKVHLEPMVVFFSEQAYLEEAFQLAFAKLQQQRFVINFCRDSEVQISLNPADIAI